MIIVKDVESLDKAIKLNGYSFRSLAKICNCSQTQISLIIKGERNPSPKLAKKLCSVLKIFFDDFFYIFNNHKSNQ